MRYYVLLIASFLLLSGNAALAEQAKSEASQDAAIAVYVSPETSEYFASVGGDYRNLLIPWRSYFEGKQINVEWLGSLEQLRGWQGRVLVVPSAVSLGADERATIKGFAQAGGGVLATWAYGVRGADDQWQGYEALDESFGVRVTHEIPPLQQPSRWDRFIGAMKQTLGIGDAPPLQEAPPRFLAVFGDTPVSHSLPAGQRVWLGTATDNLLTLDAPQLAGRFTDWAFLSEIAEDGAIAYGSVGSGRAVVFGFSETTWGFEPALIHSMVDDALAWLRAEPAAYLSAWPAGYDAAQLIEMDTEEGFPNALRFAKLLETADVTGTFYTLTSVAKQFPDVVRSLAQRHEIGYHGDIHIGFKDQPRQEQARRIETMMTDLAGILPSANGRRGFRAPLESYDATTEVLLAEAGLDHHVADPAASGARLPFLSRHAPADAGLVVLPRTQRDDINLLQEGVSTEQIQERMVADAVRTWNMGGLGVLSIHTQNMGKQAPIAQALSGALGQMTDSPAQVWFATGSAIAEWARNRQRAQLKPVGGGSYELTVQDGPPIKGLTVRVNNMAKGQPLDLTLNGEPLLVELDGPYQSVAVLPEVQPGTVRLEALR